MNEYEQEGYDAYIRGLVVYGHVMPAYANSVCPYGYGSEERRDWMDGWQKAREEA